MEHHATKAYDVPALESGFGNTVQPRAAQTVGRLSDSARENPTCPSLPRPLVQGCGLRQVSMSGLCCPVRPPSPQTAGIPQKPLWPGGAATPYCCGGGWGISAEWQQHVLASSQVFLIQTN